MKEFISVRVLDSDDYNIGNESDGDHYILMTKNIHRVVATTRESPFGELDCSLVEYIVNGKLDRIITKETPEEIRALML